MEIVYTILIVNFNRHILSFFFSDAARGAIFSKAVIIKVFVLLHIFYFTEFSVDFGMIIAKTRIEE